MSFSAVIVAAGGGSRAGAGPAKQWRNVAGKPVVRWSVETFFAAGASEVVVVIPASAQTELAAALHGLDNWRSTVGGPSRAASVRNGLAALSCEGETPVMIHDAARLFLGCEHIRALLEALDEAEGAAPALPVADTLKRRDGERVTTTSRDGLWRVQTPQAFRRKALEQAYSAWTDAADPTDDCAVVEASGGRIVLTAGDPMLMKLTYPEDFAMAERLAGGARVTRIGQGFDAHRWGPGDEVWLCGVAIAHNETLIGHSDADAGLHALTDAILGAIGEGDIGDHFPPTDPKWKGASSDRFLVHAAELVAAKGGQIINVDVTLICERPKIKPHRQAMRERLAALLNLPLDRVSVKATTTEGMGFPGRGEGLAAQAVAAVETPL